MLAGVVSVNPWGAVLVKSNVVDAVLLTPLVQISVMATPVKKGVVSGEMLITSLVWLTANAGGVGPIWKADWATMMTVNEGGVA